MSLSLVSSIINETFINEQEQTKSNMEPKQVSEIQEHLIQNPIVALVINPLGDRTVASLNDIRYKNGMWGQTISGYEKEGATVEESVTKLNNKLARLTNHYYKEGRGIDELIADGYSILINGRPDHKIQTRIGFQYDRDNNIIVAQYIHNDVSEFFNELNEKRMAPELFYAFREGYELAIEGEIDKLTKTEYERLFPKEMNSARELNFREDNLIYLGIGLREVIRKLV